MKHQVETRRLGRSPEHRRSMLRNMVTSLILSDRIETTVTRAKELRRVAEKMVTLGKKGTLAARRQVLEDIQNPVAVQKLFSVLAERYKSRSGGYTRIMRLDNRTGDNASMAIIEYVDAGMADGSKSGGKAAAKKAAPKKAKSESAPKAPRKRTPKAAKAAE